MLHGVPVYRFDSLSPFPVSVTDEKLSDPVVTPGVLGQTRMRIMPDAVDKVKW